MPRGKQHNRFTVFFIKANNDWLSRCFLLHDKPFCVLCARATLTAKFLSFSDEFISDFSNLDNLSYITETNQELTNEIEYPDLPNKEIIDTDIIIKRENIIEKMLTLYKDETIVQKKIKVAFKDKLGLDYGGLTKELFSEFWKKIMPEFFRGENQSVPFLSLSKIRKGLDENFPIIGRIFSSYHCFNEINPNKYM